MTFISNCKAYLPRTGLVAYGTFGYFFSKKKNDNYVITSILNYQINLFIEATIYF